MSQAYCICCTWARHWKDELDWGGDFTSRWRQPPESKATKQCHFRVGTTPFWMIFLNSTKIVTRTTTKCIYASFHWCCLPDPMYLRGQRAVRFFQGLRDFVAVKQYMDTEWKRNIFSQSLLSDLQNNVCMTHDHAPGHAIQGQFSIFDGHCRVFTLCSSFAGDKPPHNSCNPGHYICFIGIR